MLVYWRVIHLNDSNQLGTSACMHAKLRLEPNFRMQNCYLPKQGQVSKTVPRWEERFHGSHLSTAPRFYHKLALDCVLPILSSIIISCISTTPGHCYQVERNMPVIPGSPSFDPRSVCQPIRSMIWAKLFHLNSTKL